MMDRRTRSIVLGLAMLCIASLVSGTLLVATTFADAPEHQFQIVARYPHDPNAFTQGFVYLDGQIYEGTGLEGRSQLRLVDLATGDVLKSHDLAENEFGEGIAILENRIYQLTWKSGVAYVYDRDSFEPIDQFSYQGEGWGLATDGVSLLMSDGSSQIVFRDPETFAITRSIDVHDGDQPITRLNELEYIDGVLWANVWQTTLIARIDPATGDVIDWLDLADLDREIRTTNPNADVLNGIAWNPETETILITGKFWPTVFEIALDPDGE